MVVESKRSVKHQQPLRALRAELIICCRRPFRNLGTPKHLLPGPSPLCSHSLSSFLPLHTFPLLLPAICLAFHPSPALWARGTVSRAQVRSPLFAILAEDLGWLSLLQSLIQVCYCGLYSLLFLLLLLIGKKKKRPGFNTGNTSYSVLSTLLKMWHLCIHLQVIKTLSLLLLVWGTVTVWSKRSSANHCRSLFNLYLCGDFPKFCTNTIVLLMKHCFSSCRVCSGCR